MKSREEIKEEIYQNRLHNNAGNLINALVDILTNILQMDPTLIQDTLDKARSLVAEALRKCDEDTCKDCCNRPQCMMKTGAYGFFMNSIFHTIQELPRNNTEEGIDTK